jgi:hypothetical protein
MDATGFIHQAGIKKGGSISGAAHIRVLESLAGSSPLVD